MEEKNNSKIKELENALRQRDEMIGTLQKEVDDYGVHHKMIEDDPKGFLDATGYHDRFTHNDDVADLVEAGHALQSEINPLAEQMLHHMVLHHVHKRSNNLPNIINHLEKGSFDLDGVKKHFLSFIDEGGEPDDDIFDKYLSKYNEKLSPKVEEPTEVEITVETSPNKSEDELPKSNYEMVRKITKKKGE